MKINNFRIRSNSCIEPIQKQKVVFLKGNINMFLPPIIDKEWIKNLIDKYFGKEEK